MNVQKFTRYFCEFETENDGFVSQIPWIDIPAKTFPVDVFYLEDVCQGMDTYESYQKIVLNDPKKPSMMQERRDLFISWILRCHIDSPVEDAFLVFVPGIALIAEMVRIINIPFHIQLILMKGINILSNIRRIN